MPSGLVTILRKGIFPTVLLFSWVSRMNSCKKAIGLSPSAPVIDTPVYEYLVSFTYRNPAIVGGVPIQLYTDSAEFGLTIKIAPEAGTHPQTIAIASIHNIQNHAPTVVPATATYPVSQGVTSTFTFNPDSVGIYDIESVGIPDPWLKGDSTIAFNFYNAAGISPGFTAVQNPSGIKTIFPSGPLNAGQVVSTPKAFHVRKAEQVLVDTAQGFYYRFLPK